jgi:hypothetical protein
MDEMGVERDSDGEEKPHTHFWRGNAKGRDRLAEQGADERIISKWTSQIQDKIVWDGFVWFRMWTSGSSREHGTNIRVST